MNRKQKIIVSITGIILVSLILIGLTYAYFLTKITGNTNSKSISVTTANLVLKYGEETQDIITKEALMPGETAAVKVFSATNEGNSDVTYGAALENIVNGLTRQEDLVYTLTCTSYLKEGFSLASDGTITGTVDGTCNGVSTEKQFPDTSTLSVMATNTIDTNHTHAYKLTIDYKYLTDIDQSKDMNKTFSAKVNIVDINALTVNNPYKNDTGTLKKAIIDNAMLGVGTTVYGEVPLSSPGNEIAIYKTGNMIDGEEVVNIIEAGCTFMSWSIGNTPEEAQKASVDLTKTTQDAVGKYVYCPNKWTKKLLAFDSSTNDLTFYKSVEETKTEKTLSKTEDDYGISYYYRGNVDDNYLDYAGMCWRIVRIAGDGTIKLILEDQDSTCATSDGNWNIPTTTGGTTKTGDFGYTEHAANTLTASDGTKNSKARYLINYLNGGTKNYKSMATAFKNFQTGPLANYLDKLEAGDWCLNDKAYATSSDNTTALTSQEILDKQIKGTTFDYDSNVRLNGKTTKEPTLKCNGTNMNKFADEDNTDMYVGTLTADEIVYAGGKVYSTNPDYYLINNYQKSHSLWFWSLSPSYFSGYRDCAFFVVNNGYLSAHDVDGNAYSFRPAVSLKSSVQITGGDGIKDNPYTVKLSS